MNFIYGEMNVVLTRQKKTELVRTLLVLFLPFICGDLKAQSRYNDESRGAGWRYHDGNENK